MIYPNDLLNQYKKALDESSIVSKSDKYGNIIYANDEFCRISKYSKNELIGKPHNILRHPKMPKEAFKNLWETIKSGKVWKGIVINKAKDNSDYWVKTTIIPIKDEKDQIVEYISTRVEITELILKELKIEKLLEASKKFVPNDFLDLLNVKDISNLETGISVKTRLTVLFCDLRNFTSLSEKDSSGLIFEDLNEYFSYMQPIISMHNGFIDKYIGDAILALFYEESSAVYAAIEMKKKLISLNHLRNSQNKPSLDFGIGIHSGQLTLGTVGNTERIDTTVIGDTVNTASRIENSTKILKHRILFTEEVKNHLNDSNLLIRKLGLKRLKGKKETTMLYTVLNHFDQKNWDLIKLQNEYYNKGIDFIHQKKWNEAKYNFEELIKLDNDDYLTNYWLKKIKRFTS
jgi:two-component system sensor histidine kinase ChiS